MSPYDQKALDRLFKLSKDTQSGCREFTGAGSEYKRILVNQGGRMRSREVKPAITYRSRPVSPQALVWGLHNGFDPHKVRNVHMICGNRNCVTLEHIHAQGTKAPITLKQAEMIAKAWPITNIEHLERVLAGEVQIEDLEPTLDSIGWDPSITYDDYNLLCDNRLTPEVFNAWRTKHGVV